MIITFYFNKFKKILKDNLLKKIIKNSGIILAGNTTASALNLISFAIMAKQLGPESLALLVLAQTYAMIFNDLFNIQTWESMIKFGSAKLKNSSITNIIKTNFLLDLVSAIIAFTFALVLLKLAVNILGWDESYLNIFSLYSFSILFNITTFTIGIPRLFDKFLSVAKISVVMALLKLASVLYVMNFANSLIVYIYVYLGIDVLTNLSLIIYSMSLLSSKYGSHWWEKGFKIDKDQIRFIWWTNLRTIIRIPVRHFDMVVISSVISIQMVGIYKVYKEIAGILGRLSNPVNQAIFPEFVRLIGDNQIIQSKDVAKKMISLLFLVSLILTILMLLLAKPAVSLFFGVEYMSHMPALYLLIIFYWTVFFTTPINSLFIAAGFARYSFYLVLFSNSLFLLAVYSLGKSIGIYGIISALLIQAFINQGLKIYLMKNHSSGWNIIIR